MFFKKDQPDELKAESKLEAFVKKSPTSKYTFDSERDASESEICRVLGDSASRKDCIMVKLESKRMFSKMQELGFFCMLPQAVGQTHIECTPLPSQ